MSHRAQNNNAVNYYTSTCAGCGLKLIASRLEKRALGSRWVKCGGSNGCGTVTRVHFAVAHSPDEELSYEEWREFFDGE